MEIHIKINLDDRIVSAVRRVASRRNAGVALALGVLGASVAVFAAPLSKPHSFAAGDAIHASDINDNFDALYEELNARTITADQTIEVADCEALLSALVSLDDKRIASHATVTLELAEDTSACPSEVSIDHPDGVHIQIVGAGSDKTMLTFFGGDGFVLPMSRSVGLIDKLSIRGSNVGGHGVLVQGSASAKLGHDFVVSAFVDGVRTTGGWVHAEGVVSKDNTDDGFEAGYGGFIMASDTVASGNAMMGYNAYLSSGMLANGASAQDNTLLGYNANINSGMQVGENGSASGSEHGYNANANSAIVIFDSSASNNSAFGFAASKDSVIDAVTPTSNDNGTGFVAVSGSYVNFTNPTGNTLTVAAPGADVFNQVERSLVREP